MGSVSSQGPHVHPTNSPAHLNRLLGSMWLEREGWALHAPKEDFDIVCSFDIDVLRLRYRMSISKVFDIEGLIVRYRRAPTFDIEGH
jgi:hypothetical protein